MRFVDEITIHVRAGHGGAGCVSFIREKFREFGGPDGGDGGKGGTVRFRSHSSLQTLGALLKSQLYAAKNGEPGRGNQQTGAHGADLIIHVPVGTEIFDQITGEKLADLDRYDSEYVAAVGGIGGLGNQHFATSINQTPTHAQPGMPGQEFELHLRLKLLADVGLVGLPNAGKSTLLAAVTQHQPKIADYAFTTLTPNLGIVENESGVRRLILADIPGIIEGASKGHGLGLAFLRHIERVRLIVYVIDGANLEPLTEIRLLKSELQSYSPELLSRPALIVINKVDQMDYDLEFAQDSVEQLRSPALWPETPGHIPSIVYMSAKEKRGTAEFITELFAAFPEQTLAEAVLVEDPSGLKAPAASGTGDAQPPGDPDSPATSPGADDLPADRSRDQSPHIKTKSKPALDREAVRGPLAADVEETEPGLFTHKIADQLLDKNKERGSGGEDSL
ncbi:MAG: GTPase ObgE [bacterium]|nr:GTPase ObgE [bacterium]